jgi:long-subunit acyl-CoA synthetase (AMP-forming)
MNLRELSLRMATTPQSAVTIARLHGSPERYTLPRMAQDVQAMVQALQAAGLQPGHRVGIQASNCYEWLIWDLAVAQLGAILMAFPQDGVAGEPAHLVHEFELALMVTDRVREQTTAHAVVPLDIAPEALARSGAVACTAPLETDADLYTMVFSSGTTGHLKGLLIGRAASELLIARFAHDFDITPRDSTLIFLPLCNYQQRIMFYLCMHAGASVHFADLTQVFRALQQYRTTFVVSPPAVYDNLARIYRPHTDGGARLREALGGATRFLITVMAPIRRCTLDAFNQHGIALLQAYGVTEVGLIAWNTPERHRIGSVGHLLYPADVRVDEEGQISVGGDHLLSRGYFLDSGDDARSVFLPDGRIATGDIGQIDADGYLTLSGRRNDVIVTSGGRKFHPAELEMQLQDVAGVAQVAVLQLPDTDDIVAVTVLDGTLPEAEVLDRLLTVNESLDPYRRVARLYLAADRFTAANGCLTRNMKLNRPGVLELYRPRLGPRTHLLSGMAHGDVSPR